MCVWKVSYFTVFHLPDGWLELDAIKDDVPQRMGRFGKGEMLGCRILQMACAAIAVFRCQVGKLHPRH